MKIKERLNKKPTNKILSAILISVFLLQMFSILAISPTASHNKVWFFIDDFDNEEYSRDNWNGAFNVREYSSKIVVKDGQIAITNNFDVIRDITSEVWLLIENIDTTKLSSGSTITLQDGNTKRVLYTLTKNNIDSSRVHIQIPGYLIAGIDSMCIELSGYMSIGSIKLYSPNRYYHDFLTDGFTFENNPNIQDTLWSYGSGYTKTLTVRLWDNKIILESPEVYIPWQPVVNFSFFFDIMTPVSYEYDTYNYTYIIKIFNLDDPEQQYGEILDSYTIYESWNYPAFNTFSLTDYCGQRLKFEFSFSSPDTRLDCTDGVDIIIYLANIFTSGYSDTVSEEFSPWEFIHSNNHAYYDVATFFGEYYPALATDREGYLATYFVENSYLQYVDYLTTELIQNNYTTEDVTVFEDLELSGVSVNAENCEAIRKDVNVGDFYTELIFNLSSYDIIAGMSINNGYRNIKIGIGRTNDKPAIFIYINDAIDKVIFLNSDYYLLEDNIISVETTFGYNAYLITLNGEEHYYTPSSDGMVIGGYMGIFSKCSASTKDQIVEFKSISVLGPVRRDSSRFIMLIKSQQNIKVEVTHTVFDLFGIASVESLGVKDVLANKDTYLHFKTPDLRRLEYLQINIINDDSRPLQSPVYLGPMLILGINPFNTKINPINYFDKGVTSEMVEDTLSYSYETNTPDNFIASYDINIREPCLFEVGVLVDNILPRISIDVYTRKLFSAEPYSFQGTITWTENEEKVFGHVIFLDFSYGDYEIVLQHPHDAYENVTIHYILTRPITSSAKAYSDYTDHNLENVWQLDFNTDESESTTQFDVWEEDAYYTLHKPLVENILVDDVLQQLTDWDDVSNAIITPIEGNLAAFIGSVTLENLNIPIDHSHFPYIYFEIYSTSPLDATKVTFEDNEGYQYEFTINPNNVQDNSLTKSFILANIIGEDPDGDGRVEDSSLKLDKIIFDSYQCSHPVIFKNIHVYRIKNVETFDDYNNKDYAPYISNILLTDFNPFYIERLDNPNIHNPYTSDDKLVDFLNSDDYNYNTVPSVYGDVSEDLSWFLQQGQDGLNPLFLSNINQPWKRNEGQVLEVHRGQWLTDYPWTPLLPNYLSPAATTLELSFSVSYLDNDPRDGELLIELNFVDTLRKHLDEIDAYYDPGGVDPNQDYVDNSGDNDYYIKLKGHFFKVTEDDGPFEDAIPDAKIIWTVLDTWSLNVIGNGTYSNLPFDTSYIYYDNEYKITIDYGRPYYGDPDPDEDNDYRHNIAYSLLYDYLDYNPDFRDEDECGNFGGFTVSFDNDILLGGAKENKNHLTDPFVKDDDLSLINCLNKYPLFTQTFLAFGAAPISYDMHWSVNRTFFNQNGEELSLLDYEDFEINTPTLTQMYKDSFSSADYLNLPIGTRIEPILNANLNISEYYLDLVYGCGILTLETDTDGWNQLFGVHTLTEVHNYIHKKLTNSTLPELNKVSFQSTKNAYINNQDWGYASTIDSLYLTFFTHTPSSYLSLDGANAIGGDWTILDKSIYDSTDSYSIDSGPKGIQWIYDKDPQEFWEDNSFYLSCGDTYYYYWINHYQEYRSFGGHAYLAELKGNPEGIFDTDYVLLNDDLPLRIVDYGGPTANKFLLKAEFKIDKWTTNDLPTDVLFTSGALILPGESEPEVLRIKILHYGYNEDREWTIKYSNQDIDTLTNRLEHQEITYVYIGNALLGAFPASEEITLNFEILVSKETTYEYLINIYCDNPRYDEGLNWYYYNLASPPYGIAHVPFSQDIMENTNVHTEYIIEGQNDKYSFEYVYPEVPHYIPVHDHVVAFENSSYFTDSEEYRHNNIYNDGSFGFTVGFGNDQFTYIDYIPITDSFDEKEIQELEGDYTWSGTTGIGTGYSDSLIIYPNSKFRFVDKLSGNLDITFDLDMFAMNIENLDNSIEIGLAIVGDDSNYYYNGMKFVYDDFNNEWWESGSVAVGEIDEDHIYYNHPDVISHLSIYDNFFVRLQYDETTHIMRFWIWKWNEIIDLDNYIELRIDLTDLDTTGVKPYISVGGSLLFVHSIFSNTFHYEDDEVLTQLPSMNGQGELGDYYLRYNTNQMLNCSGSVDFIYSTEDGLSSPEWSLDFMPSSTDFKTIITNEYFNDTINEWITVGYIKITHNSVHFGNNGDLLLQVTGNDIIKTYEWNYISLNYYYSPIVDENNVTIREGEFILVINEDEYNFNTSVVVGSGEYRFTLSNSIGSVHYDNIQVFNYYEYFSTHKDFEDNWGIIVKGGFWRISINAYTTNLYLTVIGCSIQDGLSNITIIINDNHILRDMWIQSSPFPNLEHYRYPINLNVIGTSPNNILKLRFIAQGLTSVYGFSLATRESVTDILYTAETYNLEEQREWKDIISTIDDPDGYLEETDSSAIVNPVFRQTVEKIDYTLDIIDAKEGLTLSGFVKGKGKIVIEVINCRGNYRLTLIFNLGTNEDWYEGEVTYEDMGLYVQVTACFPLSLIEDSDEWRYFEVDLYQVLAHIPAYDGQTTHIDELSLKYLTRAFNFVVTNIGRNIETIKYLDSSLQFADFKYSIERSSIGEFPSSESTITIDSDEGEQTSALWKIKELGESGVIDIDTIFERAIEPNTVDNYYFMVYADSFSAETIFIEIDSDLPFTIYQSGIAIYTKNDFKRNNAFIPINVLGGISTILFKIVRPSGNPNHLMHISYIAFGDISIGGSVFQQNEYITQWLYTQPFGSEVLHNTEGLIGLINDICPKKGDRLKTPYGNLEFNQLENEEDVFYIDFESDIKLIPSVEDYIILYTNLYYAQDLEDAELIIQKGLDNNFGFDIKLFSIDGYQLIQNEDSIFNEVDTGSDTLTIPLLNRYAIPSVYTQSYDDYRGRLGIDLIRPRLDPGPMNWKEGDYVVRNNPYDDPTGDQDLETYYEYKLDINSKGFHRILMLVQITDTSQPLNVSVRLKNRMDKVFEVLEPSPIRVNYNVVLSRLDTLMYEGKPFNEVAGGTSVIDNEHVLAGGFFRDDLGGFHNYRIYFLGASDFETLLEVESYYRLDEPDEENYGIPQIYDGGAGVPLASYVLFNMNFAIKIDEGFNNNYMNTYSITAGRWWFRTVPDVNGTYEMVTAPAVPILSEEEIAQINSEMGAFSLTSSSSTSSCYSVGDTEIILDGLGQSRANFIYDPTTHGTFTAEGYTIDGYTLMEGDFIGDDIYQSNPVVERYLSFNEYSNQYVDLLDLEEETDSSTHYLTFTNADTYVETEIIRTVGINTEIIINANDSDFIWTLHNRYIEVIPKADADKYKKTYITSSGSFTIYSNNLDNPDYNGTYNDVFDNPDTIQAIQSKIELPYEIPLSLSGTYDDPDYFDPTKTSFAEWFEKLIIQCFNQEEQLDVGDAVDYSSYYMEDGEIKWQCLNLADYNTQDQVKLLDVDITGLSYIDVRVLRDVFNLKGMEDRFTDWMEGILDLIQCSYDPFEDSPTHSFWYHLWSFVSKALRIAWNVIKFFWRLMTGFSLGTTDGDKGEMLQQRTDYAYVKFHSTFMFFWALILGNSEGAGIPLKYYTGEASEAYTVLDKDKCTRTHSILEFDYLWDAYLNHLSTKTISNVNSKLPFADSAYADAVVNSTDSDLSNMRDWVTSPNYQPEAYNMCERDANIYLWLKSKFLKYGPYSIGVYTKEMMASNIQPLGFDDHYLVIAVWDGTSTADGDSYKWLISLDKHYKLSIDQIYIQFGITELEFLTTIEMIGNIFPVIALYEDVRDSIIVQNSFFRALSRIQIPMDIVDIFTRVSLLRNSIKTSARNAKLVQQGLGTQLSMLEFATKQKNILTMHNSLRQAWSYLEYTVFLPWGAFQGSMKLFMKNFGKALIKSNRAFARLPDFLASILSLDMLIKKQRLGSIFALFEVFATSLTKLVTLEKNGRLDTFIRVLTPSNTFAQINEVTSSEAMAKTSLTDTIPPDSTITGKTGVDTNLNIARVTYGFSFINNDHIDRMRTRYAGSTVTSIDDANIKAIDSFKNGFFDYGVPGKTSSQVNTLQTSLILALMALDKNISPKTILGENILKELDVIAKKIKEVEGISTTDENGNPVTKYPAFIQHLKTFQDLMDDRLKGKDALKRFRAVDTTLIGDLVECATKLDIYLVTKWANDELKNRLNKYTEDEPKPTTPTEARQRAAKIWEDLQEQLTLMGAGGVIIPVVFGPDRNPVGDVGVITTSNGILKFDVNQIKYDETTGKIDFEDEGWGPIDINMDYIIPKGPKSIDNINYREMILSIQGFDIVTKNGAWEFKNNRLWGTEEVGSALVQANFGRNMDTLAELIKNKFLTNYFVDDEGKPLDIDAMTKDQIEQFLRREDGTGYKREFNEINLMRLLNTFTRTIDEKSDGLKTDPETAKRLALKLQLEIMLISGITVNLVFLKDVFSAEVIDATGRTELHNMGYKNGDDKNVIDIDEVYHASVDTDTLKTLLTHGRSMFKTELEGENTHIEAAFMVNVPQPRIGDGPIRTICFVVNKNGVKSNYIVDYEDIKKLNDDYNKDINTYIKPLLEVFITDKVGETNTGKNCLGTGIEIETDSDGLTTTIIKHTSETVLDSDKTHLFEMVYLDGRTFPAPPGGEAPLSKAILISPLSYDLVEIDPIKGAFLTLRDKNGDEIDGMIKLFFKRGIMGCDYKTDGRPNDLSYRFQRVFLYSLLTTNNVPYLKTDTKTVDRDTEVSTSYEWVDISLAIKKMEELKTYITTSEIDDDTKSKTIDAIYKSLIENMGIDPTCKSNAVIARIEDTIEYYKDLNNAPKIDAYTKTTLKFDVETKIEEVERISNPYFLGYKHCNVMDTSILTIDDAISLYNNNMERLTNAFKENTNMRKVVMGGDGAYLRLKEREQLGDETNHWRYRTNAADAIDYFQSSLITDVYTRYIHKDIKDPGVSIKNIMQKYRPYTTSRYRPNRVGLMYTHAQQTYINLRDNIFYKQFRDSISKKNNVDLVNNIKKDITAFDKKHAVNILYNRVEDHFENNPYLKPLLDNKMMTIVKGAHGTIIYFREKGKQGDRVFSISATTIRCQRQTLESLIIKLGGDILGDSEVSWPTTNPKAYKETDSSLIKLINSEDETNGIRLAAAREALKLIWENIDHRNPIKNDVTRRYLNTKSLSDQEIIDSIALIGMIEKLDDYCSFIKDEKLIFDGARRINSLRSIDIKLIEKAELGTFRIEINLNTEPQIHSLETFEKLGPLRYLVPEALSFDGRDPELFNQFETYADNFFKPYTQAHKYENKDDQGPYKVDSEDNWAYYIKKYVNWWAGEGIFGKD